MPTTLDISPSSNQLKHFTSFGVYEGRHSSHMATKILFILPDTGVIFALLEIRLDLAVTELFQVTKYEGHVPWIQWSAADGQPSFKADSGRRGRAPMCTLCISDLSLKMAPSAQDMPSTYASLEQEKSIIRHTENEEIIRMLSQPSITWYLS